jgi:hypothetical protein
MQRRGFLAALGTLAAGYALDPERLLWVPGAKTFFLPSIEGVRGCPPGPLGALGPPGFLTIDIITREALRVLENNLQFARVVNRQYEDRWLRCT